MVQLSSQARFEDIFVLHNNKKNRVVLSPNLIKLLCLKTSTASAFSQLGNIPWKVCVRGAGFMCQKYTLKSIHLFITFTSFIGVILNIYCMKLIFSNSIPIQTIYYKGNQHFIAVTMTAVQLNQQYNLKTIEKLSSNNVL